MIYFNYRKEIEKMKILRTLGIIVYIGLLLLGAWGIVSYIDIVLDNLSANPQHFDWNLFVLFNDGAR